MSNEVFNGNIDRRLAELRPDWQTLEAGAFSPMQQFGWLAAQDPFKPQIFENRVGGVLKAAVVLKNDPSGSLMIPGSDKFYECMDGISGTRQDMNNVVEQFYGRPLNIPRILADSPLTPALISNHRSSGSVILLPETSKEMIKEAVRNLPGSEVLIIRRAPPYLFIDLQKSQFSEGNRNGSTKTNTKKMKRLARDTQSEVNFQIYTPNNKQEAEALIDRVYAIQERSWKVKRGEPITDDPGGQILKRYLIAAAAEKKLRVPLVTLTSDSQSLDIAGNLEVDLNGGRFSFKTYYAKDFAEYSLGSNITARTVSDARERGLLTFEMMGIDQPWKREWATPDSERTSLSLLALPQGVRGMVALGQYLANSASTRHLSQSLNSALLYLHLDEVAGWLNL